MPALFLPLPHLEELPHAYTELLITTPPYCPQQPPPRLGPKGIRPGGTVQMDPGRKPRQAGPGSEFWMEYRDLQYLGPGLERGSSYLSWGAPEWGPLKGGPGCKESRGRPPAPMLLMPVWTGLPGTPHASPLPKFPLSCECPNLPPLICGQDFHFFPS